jgi:hypothetical protein
MEPNEIDSSRIHGFTSWINMRLMPFEQGLSNILTDLMKGTNMKLLLQSVTGTTTEKIQSFEKLSSEQIRTRCEWAVKHLKEQYVFFYLRIFEIFFILVKLYQKIFKLMLVCLLFEVRNMFVLKS